MYHKFPCDVYMLRYAMTSKSNMATVLHLGLEDPANFIPDSEIWEPDLSSYRKEINRHRNEQSFTDG